MNSRGAPAERISLAGAATPVITVIVIQPRTICHTCIPGTVFSGLRGKLLYPMVSSTAARTGMKLVKACSYSTSLQFLCCCVLRRMIPSHLDVTSALRLPPGLHDFLVNNLGWLLRPCELGDVASPRSSSSCKRRFDGELPGCSGDPQGDSASKRPRLAPLAEGLSDLDDDDDDDDSDDDDGL